MTILDSRGNEHRPAGAPAGGQFANKQNSAPSGALADAPASEAARADEPFILDRSKDMAEQVRHLLPAYRARRAELETAGKNVFYDESFHDMPEIAANTDRDRGSIIYYLRQLEQIEQEDRLEAEFLAAGGREVTREEFQENPGLVLRGTVVQRGEYVGGTGWRVYDDVRLISNGRGSVFAIPKGKRTNGYMVSPSNARSRVDSPNLKLLFKPSGKK